jgi:alpha-galactosidase
VNTVTFTDRNGLTAVWRTWINGVARDTKLDEIKVSDQSFSFRMHYSAEYISHWRGKFVNDNELKMTVIEDDGTPDDTRVFRRASLQEVAQAIAGAPRNLKTQKIALPQLRALPTNSLAPTPPMGWNSWNHFREAIDDKVVREMADALVSSGLRDAGYMFLNIDDGWQGRRDQNGVLHPNIKFPDMKALADYVHAKGLKLGIYSSAGPLSCAGYVGSHGYEAEDAETFARWRVDLLKYDWCSAFEIYKAQPEMQALYQKMGEALQATGRPIVYSLCQYGLFDVGSWGRKVGGNLWRTGGDTVAGNRWASISARFESNGQSDENGPGGWNDPDMMLIGNGGLSEEEQRTHMTLWAMLAAPLILGNDLRLMTPAVRAIVTNREVIAVDQDALGKQGRPVYRDGFLEIWTKPLADGATALALFNRGDAPATIKAKWAELGLSGPQRVRDLWKQTDLGHIDEGYEIDIAAHDSVLLKVVRNQDERFTE